MEKENVWKITLAAILIGLAGGVTQSQQPGTAEAQMTGKLEVAPVQLPEIQQEERTPAAGQETAEEIAEEEYWDNLEMLAVCVEAEAGNQSLFGKRLVVDVILNRVDDGSGLWEDTIQDVISQPTQFTSYWDGGMESIVEPSEESFEAVRMELEERSYPGIFYFREGQWPDYGEHWKKVEDHYFSKK